MDARTFMALVARSLLGKEPNFNEVRLDAEPKRGTLTLLFIDPQFFTGQPPAKGSTCFMANKPEKKILLQQRSHYSGACGSAS
jgi:hypothetical protein